MKTTVWPLSSSAGFGVIDTTIGVTGGGGVPEEVPTVAIDELPEPTWGDPATATLAAELAALVEAETDPLGETVIVIGEEVEVVLVVGTEPIVPVPYADHPVEALPKLGVAIVAAVESDPATTDDGPATNGRPPFPLPEAATDPVAAKTTRIVPPSIISATAMAHQAGR